jgi:hypothetical protein
VERNAVRWNGLRNAKNGLGAVPGSISAGWIGAIGWRYRSGRKTGRRRFGGLRSRKVSSRRTSEPDCTRQPVMCESISGLSTPCNEMNSGVTVTAPDLPGSSRIFCWSAKMAREIQPLLENCVCSRISPFAPYLSVPEVPSRKTGLPVRMTISTMSAARLRPSASRIACCSRVAVSR